MRYIEKLVHEATESLIGHIAMGSVTGYVTRHINETYGTEFEDTDALVEYLQFHGAEIDECPNCGWYVEYLDWSEKEQTEACDGCVEDLDYYEEN